MSEQATCVQCGEAIHFGPCSGEPDEPDLEAAADIVRALAKLDDAALSTACWAIRKLHRRAIAWVARNPVTR